MNETFLFDRPDCYDIHKQVDVINPSRYGFVFQYKPSIKILGLHYEIFPHTANPRRGYTGVLGVKQSPLDEELMASTISGSGNFHLKNTGIIMFGASAIEVPEGVLFNCGSLDLRGVSQGGTTLEIGIEAFNKGWRQPEDPKKATWYNLALRCGAYTNEDVITETTALNRMWAVSHASRLNINNQFVLLQDILEADPNFPSMSWFVGCTDENGKAPEYSVEKVLQVIALFSVTRPSTVINAAGQALNWYEKPLAQERCEALSDVIPSFFYLKEHFCYRLPLLVRGFLNKAMITRESQKETWLPYLNKKIPYTPWDFWVLPCLSAFRPLLKPGKNGKWQWVTNPVKLVDKVASPLFNACNMYYDKEKFQRDLHRQPSLYALLENIVLKA
jgi:hypothetical protein